MQSINSLKSCNNLHHLVDTTLEKCILLIIGDWDNKVGNKITSEIMRKCCLTLWNEAGNRLITVLPSILKVYSNYIFQLSKRGLYTWTFPDGD